jgi:hypothetical protein
MMGLEPTTFCMARTPHEPTRHDVSRQTAQWGGFDLAMPDPYRQQATRKAD